jgi:hypothetical protein
MSKPAKIALGIATLWPLFYMLIFMGFCFYMLLSGVPAPEKGAGMPSEFMALFIMHGITILWQFALLAIYIHNVFTNDRVEKDKKALWAVVLFLGNMIAMPIYWYVYIWREDTAPAPPEPSHERHA